MSEMNLLISQEKDIDKRAILRKLKQLNHDIYMKMERPGLQRWSNYTEMQKTIEWKKARLLLRDYFKTNGKLICPICLKEIKGSFTLHHKEYPKSTSKLFLPTLCQIICSHHHTLDFHKKGIKK